MQGAFIDALVHPVFKTLAELLPLVDEFCIKTLQSNRAFWNSMQNQDIITTSNVVTYLKGIRDPRKEYSSGETENVVSNSELLESPIPGIPANAPKAHSTRKMSLISIKSKIGNLDDPELGEAALPSGQGESQSSSTEKKMFLQKIRIALRRFLESGSVQILLLLATVYALFANDINVAMGSRDADMVVDLFTLFVLVIFVVELVVSIICVPKYSHFFLWLDLAATISLFIEIDLFFRSSDTPGELSLAKASRAAKAGARAGR
jgi:hypothetical protein